MKCSKCGTINPENAVFCKDCGASLLKQAQENDKVETVSQEQEETSTTQKTISVNGLIKKWATSSLFLTAVILFTVSVGFSMLFNVAAGAGAVTGIIPSIIALIGLWIIYSSAKGNKEINKTGLTMLKVISIILTVVISVVFGICGVICVIAGAIMPQVIDIIGDQFNQIIQEAQSIVEAEGMISSDVDLTQIFTPETFGIIMIVMGVMFIIIMVFGIIFYTKATKTIKKIDEMIKTGTVKENISMGFIVLLFVFGGISALNFGLNAVCEGLAYILFGITLLKFKEEAEQIIQNNERNI